MSSEKQVTLHKNNTEYVEYLLQSLMSSKVSIAAKLSGGHIFFVGTLIQDSTGVEDLDNKRYAVTNMPLATPEHVDTGYLSIEFYVKDIQRISQFKDESYGIFLK